MGKLHFGFKFGIYNKYVNKLEEKESLLKLNLTHVIIETEKTATAMFKEV